jgi:hypothetical protein
MVISTDGMSVRIKKGEGVDTELYQGGNVKPQGKDTTHSFN